MEELKSCPFCGRYIDKTFAYCPYCGFEFGQREAVAEYREDIPVISSISAGSEEGRAEAAVPRPADYLARLKNLEDVLSEMERELDLILSDAVTSSSKGP